MLLSTGTTVAQCVNLALKNRYTHSERRRPSHLPWCNFRQEADMEAAYPTHRGKGTQKAGNHAQTSWNNMGSQ